MKTNDNNIFKPNIFLFIVGLVASTFFIGVIVFIVLLHRHNFKTMEFIICGLLLAIFVWCLTMCLDTWTVRISKGVISVKRLWSNKWTDIYINSFNKINFKAGLDDHMILYKKLTLFLNDNRRFNFYSYTENLGDNLYIALLHQTPTLLNDYKKRKSEIENKINTRQKNYKWELLIALIVLAIITIWTQIK